jgi:peptidoglycan/xylan/chitin deacetylase (PgdA/CDA1 family)
MAYLLIGYDVEETDAEINRSFLEKAAEIHSKFNAPCTLFITGRVLENNVRLFQKVKKNNIFDFQQHTYSHLPLKTTPYINRYGEMRVAEGGSLRRIQEEVRRTNQLFKEILAVDCIGLTGPYTYYQGLSDRKDILGMLYDLGIRFTRTFGRNRDGSVPLSLDIQPFWYKEQGFGQILEFPITGWKGEYYPGYLEDLKSNLNYILKHNLVWCFLQHDYSHQEFAIKDPQLKIIEKILQHALEKKAVICSYKQYYLKALKNENRTDI